MIHILLLKLTLAIQVSVQFSSVQLLSRVRLCDPINRSTPASLSTTNSQSLLKLMSIEWVMPSSHLILCRPLLLLPPIPPSIRNFSNESTIVPLNKKQNSECCRITADCAMIQFRIVKFLQCHFLFRSQGLNLNPSHILWSSTDKLSYLRSASDQVCNIGWVPSSLSLSFLCFKMANHSTYIARLLFGWEVTK